MIKIPFIGCTTMTRVEVVEATLEEYLQHESESVLFGVTWLTRAQVEALLQGKALVTGNDMFILDEYAGVGKEHLTHD